MSPSTSSTRSRTPRAVRCSSAAFSTPGASTSTARRPGRSRRTAAISVPAPPATSHTTPSCGHGYLTSSGMTDGRAPAHRRGEQLLLLGVLGEVRPHGLPVGERERRLPGAQRVLEHVVGAAGGPEVDVADPRPPRARMVLAEQRAVAREAEAPVTVQAQPAVADQRAQHSVDGVGVQRQALRRSPRPWPSPSRSRRGSPARRRRRACGRGRRPSSAPRRRRRPGAGHRRATCARRRAASAARATGRGGIGGDAPAPSYWLKKPFSISCARSSAEISTLRGVSMKTLSAIRCMPPSSA